MTRRPTTTASTPRPSANAAPMMKVARIWAAASGLRPIAAVERPVRIPIPMPGPMTPSAARPAPIISILSCYLPGARLNTGLVLRAGVGRESGSMGAGRMCGGHWRSNVALGDIVLLVLVVSLDGDDSEHQGQQRKDECLHEIQQHFEADHGRGNDRDRESRDDAQCNLAAVDVAEESHRQRDRFDELEQKLDDTDEERDQPGREAFRPEGFQAEELAEIPANSQRADPLDVEHREAEESQADCRVHVTCWRTQLMDASYRRHQPAPVAQQDE